MGAYVAHFAVMSWLCCCVLVAENCPRMFNVRATDQNSYLEYKLARVFFCLMQLVVIINVIPVSNTWVDNYVSGVIRTCRWRPSVNASSQSSSRDISLLEVSKLHSISMWLQLKLFVLWSARSGGQCWHEKSSACSWPHCFQCWSVKGIEAGYLRVSSVLVVHCQWEVSSWRRSRQIMSSVPDVVGGTETSVAKGSGWTDCATFVSLWLGWDGCQKFPVVHKVIQVMFVTASGGGYVLDFEDLSFSCFGYNKVWSAVFSVLSFFRHVDVAACALIKDKMVPGCVELAQKIRRLRDPERARTWYGVSVRSRELLYGNCVDS